MALISQQLSFVPNFYGNQRIQMCHNHNNQNAHVPNTPPHKIDTCPWSLRPDIFSDRSTKLDSLSRSQKSKGKELQDQHAQKLKDVRDALRVLEKDPLEGLAAVDALQRLGIDSHYEKEIRAILSRLYAHWRVFEADQERDLFQVALAFRLLRQEGYCVSEVEWWDDKGLAYVMKRARNQLLKWYMWSMAIFEDPSHSKQRINITKLISLIYTIDDVYGTLEELVLFTEAVNRDENQEGIDGSYIDCYMNEHKNMTWESAQVHVQWMISDAWNKRLNKECLASGSHSAAFRKLVLNVARMVPLMYSYDNNHCLPGLEEQLKSQLYEEISLPEIILNPYFHSS